MLVACRPGQLAQVRHTLRLAGARGAQGHALKLLNHALRGGGGEGGECGEQYDGVHDYYCTGA